LVCADLKRNQSKKRNSLVQWKNNEFEKFIIDIIESMKVCKLAFSIMLKLFLDTFFF